MGAAARHRRAFLKAHPRCAFCGGKAAAATIEHCPPRALFQFRQWPEGFEFPSCEECNQSTGDYDLLVAMLARMDPFNNKGDRDGKQLGLMRMAHQQFPGLFEKMMPSPSEARRSNRELGVRPGPGQTHQEVGGIKITNELHYAVSTLARKLAKGLFFRETSSPFPDHGCLLLNWFTNVELLKSARYPMFDLLNQIGGEAPPLRRSGQYLNDQFAYKLSCSSKHEYLALQARFGNSFGLVVFGSTVPGKLEAIIKNLREQTQQEGPFQILQSPLIASRSANIV